MKKPTSRRVRVDLGYGPAEHHVEARVIDSRKVKNLFDNGESEDLLVETPGGERIWVTRWEDLPERTETKTGGKTS